MLLFENKEFIHKYESSFSVADLFRQSFPSTESLPTTVSSRSKVSTQPSDHEPTYPPLPPYPPPPPSASPPPYSYIPRERSHDGIFLPRDDGSSPISRGDHPPPPYSFAPRTLPHDVNKPQPAPRHQFFKAESLTLETSVGSDRDYLLMKDHIDRGEYHPDVELLLLLARSMPLGWLCL